MTDDELRRLAEMIRRSWPLGVATATVVMTNTPAPHTPAPRLYREEEVAAALAATRAEGWGEGRLAGMKEAAGIAEAQTDEGYDWADGPDIAAAIRAAVLALLDRLRDAEVKGMMRAAEIAEKETAGGLSPYNLRHAVIAIRAAAAAHRGGAGDE